MYIAFHYDSMLVSYKQVWLTVRRISMAWCKTAVTPLLTHWSYCSLALNYRYVEVVYFLTTQDKNNEISRTRPDHGCSLSFKKHSKLWNSFSLKQNISPCMNITLTLWWYIQDLAGDTAVLKVVISAGNAGHNILKLKNDTKSSKLTCHISEATALPNVQAPVWLSS